MHKYRHEKLPLSFSGIFTDTLMSDELRSRQNDYNYCNEQIKQTKQIIFNWNALEID